MNPNPTLPLIAIQSAPAANVPPRQPRVWSVFATWFVGAIVGQLLVFVAFAVLAVGMTVVLRVMGADNSTVQIRIRETIQSPLPALLVTLLPFQFGLTGIVLLAAWISQRPLKQRLGLVPPAGRTFGGLSLATMGGFTLSLALAASIGLTLLMGQPPTGPAGEAANDGPWWLVALLSFVIYLVPAVLEEIVFRGYLQRRLLERWSPSVAIGVSTLLFAILHADSLQHVLAVVPLGLVTGLLAYRANSVIPGMLLHAVHNAGAVGAGAFVCILTPMLGDEGAGLALIGAIVLLGLLGLPAIARLLRGQESPRAPRERTLLEPAGDALASPAA